MWSHHVWVNSDSPWVDLSFCSNSLGRLNLADPILAFVFFCLGRLELYTRNLLLWIFLFGSTPELLRSTRALHPENSFFGFFWAGQPVLSSSRLKLCTVEIHFLLLDAGRPMLSMSQLEPYAKHEYMPNLYLTLHIRFNKISTQQINIIKHIWVALNHLRSIGTSNITLNNL